MSLTTTGVRLPTATEPDESWFFGAWVKEPTPGIHENVVYPDLSSLYPNTILTLNISPETIVGTWEDLEYSQWSEDDCLHGYVDPRPVKRIPEAENWRDYITGEQCFKAIGYEGDSGVEWSDEPLYDRYYYLKPSIRKGILASGVETIMQLNADYKGTDMYQASKRIRNSLYGYVGLVSSPFFDVRMCESVTLTGRKVIQHTADVFCDHVTRPDDDEPAQVVGGDTDSCVTTMDSSLTREQVLERAQAGARYLNNDSYDAFARDEFGVDNHYFEVEIESYADNVYLHPKKKRYCQHVTWDEGDDVDEIDIKGFECVRSDQADVTESVQRDILETLVMHEPETAKEYISKRLQSVCEVIRSGDYPIEELGKRSGFGQPVSEYGSSEKRAPTIRRGAKYANQNLGENITQGSKPFGFPVTAITDPSLPTTYTAETAEDGDDVDYIATTEPTMIEDKMTIDYETIIAKTIDGPIRPIVETMGWDYDALKQGQIQSGIEDFW